MFKWLRKIFKAQKMVVGKNSTGIQAGGNIIINSFKGRGFHQGDDESVTIVDNEVWVNGVKIEKR